MIIIMVILTQFQDFKFLIIKIILNFSFNFIYHDVNLFYFLFYLQLKKNYFINHNHIVHHHFKY